MDYVDVFRHNVAKTLTLQQAVNHTMELELVLNFALGRNCSLHDVTLTTLNTYIETNHVNRHIRWSSVFIVAPIIFVKMKDKSLQLCVDYQSLHKARLNDWYLLSQLLRRFNRLHGSWKLLKLNSNHNFHLLWIKHGNEYTIPCSIWHSQCQYDIILFPGMNKSDVFSACINDCACSSTNNIAMYYRKDVLKYITNEKQYEEQRLKVQRCQWESGLYS